MPIKQRTNITREQLRWRAILIFLLTLLCLVVVFPTYANKGINWINKSANLGIPTLPEAGFNLGLDLQGGAHLIYKADTSVVQAGADKGDAVEGVRDVIERRVRGGLGVAEPLVQTTRVGDEHRIIIELPGVTDVNQAIKMIGETPILEFKEENNESSRELTAEEKKQMNDYNAGADKKMKEALAEVSKGAKFEDVVLKYSEDDKIKFPNGYMGFIDSEIFPQLYVWAEGHKDGDISKEAEKSFDGLNILKRISSQDGEKKVSASHLLICYKGAEGCASGYTKERAKEKIEELKKQANPQNFAGLVRQYSTEPNATSTAGDLGTFKEADMVPAFSKVAFEMPVGTVSDPVETQFGYHLIYKKSEKTEKLYEMARVFVKTKQPSDIVPPAGEWKSTGLSGKQLKRAEVDQDYTTGQVQVALQFNDEGTKLFADITRRNVTKPVAIFLDGSPISIPRVNEAILNGSAVISGGFTLSEAKVLAQRLNSGALPVPIELISQQKVDATLGSDSLQKSLKAGLLGLAAVLLFMLAYYRLPGLLAGLALLIYALLTLTILKIMGVTLTLSGIAGFILSIGMAVDANVLVFERLKEELRWGKSLKSGMEEAFVRSWTSIRDSNITTLISCVFLVWMGTGFVQGFAVVLSAGVLVSMFTAIVITRTLLRLVAPRFGEFGNILFLGYKKKQKESNQKVKIDCIY